MPLLSTDSPALTGDYRIDALLITSMSPALALNARAAMTGSNVVTFSFYGAGAVVDGYYTTPSGLAAEQQYWVHQALLYVSGITGIAFVEVASNADSDILFYNGRFEGASAATLILFSGEAVYPVSNNYRDYYYTSINPDIEISFNLDIMGSDWYPGTWGYKTVLHEIGHALGLKHPFDGDVRLPAAEDNSSNTLYDDGRTTPTPTAPTTLRRSITSMAATGWRAPGAFMAASAPRR